MSDTLNEKTETCPACKTNLTYEYEGQNFTRLIGVYDRDRDRTVAFRCPDCGHEETR